MSPLSTLSGCFARRRLAPVDEWASCFLMSSHWFRSSGDRPLRSPGVHEREAPAQLVTGQHEVELAVLDALLGRLEVAHAARCPTTIIAPAP